MRALSAMRDARLEQKMAAKKAVKNAIAKFATCRCGHIDSLHAGYTGTCAGFIGEKQSCACKSFEKGRP